MFQLDSATSLIQAAKNLMNAVVLTVKSSYVASTKYPRPAGQVVVSSKSRFSVAMLNRVKWANISGIKNHCNDLMIVSMYYCKILFPQSLFKLYTLYSIPVSSWHNSKYLNRGHFYQTIKRVFSHLELQLIGQFNLSSLPTIRFRIINLAYLLGFTW